MKKYTQNRLNEIIKNVEDNFSEIIDFIIYFDSIDEDQKAWNLIHMIENLDCATEINLVLDDFNSRDLSKSETLLYNAIIYGLVNDEESREALIDALKNQEQELFKKHLYSLNKNKGRDGDLNIEYIFKKLNDSNNKNRP